jgi:hypothetical protein
MEGHRKRLHSTLTISKVCQIYGFRMVLQEKLGHRRKRSKNLHSDLNSVVIKPTPYECNMINLIQKRKRPDPMEKMTIPSEKCPNLVKFVLFLLTQPFFGEDHSLRLLLLGLQQKFLYKHFGAL